MLALVGLATAFGGLRPASAQEAPTRVVDVVEVSGLIDPVVVDFLHDAIDRAEAQQVEALILQLDSAGSVVPPAELDALAFRLAHSSVPVAVWVGPSGAQATGGAALLVTAAPLAGLAPGSRLGDAPAPALGDLPAVVRTGTVDAEEAFDLGLVPLNREEAATIGLFLSSLDGRTVGGTTLDTADFEEVEGAPPIATPNVRTRFFQLDLVSQLMHTVASPAVAYLLLASGLALVVFEFFTAGVGVAAGVAALALVLSSYGLAVLPTSPVGLALVLVGVAGFAVDVQSGVPRFWTGVGTVTFALGSVLLFDGVSLPWPALLTGIVGMVLMMLSAMPAVVRSRFSTPTIGRESMIGELGEAVADVQPDGVVRVREALWPARTNRATPIGAGARVRVIGIDGMLLEVEPEEGGARDYRR